MVIRQFAERLVMVIKPHARSYEDPLRASKDEILTVSAKETEWPGWIWCHNAEGRSGWVPEDFVRREDDRAILLRDYDAGELTVSVGDHLYALERVAGWTWCRTASGELGWIPNDCLTD